MTKVLLYIFTMIIVTRSSKCPEPKKPHPTSCTIFYNCVNLPTGGYVWVPAKCTNGLVFQPYLRICVLPGDSWTCDTLSTESSLITKKYEIPELTNPNENSYLDSTSNSVNLSEYVDSSHTTDDISEAVSGEMFTPYPLIEFKGEAGKYKNTSHNLVVSDSHTEKNHLHLDKNSNPKDKYSLLRQLINHLLIYKEITIPMELLASSSSSDQENLTVNSAEMTQPIEMLEKNQHNVLMNYLIQNYIQQNNLHNTVISAAKPDSPPQSSKGTTTEKTNTPAMSSTSETTVRNITINDSEAESNIVLVTDNFGYKRYVTVAEYKLLANQLNSQFAVIIPCVKNVRLLNKTECTRYYTCDPGVAVVKEYSCPQNTAFNRYTRICDVESYEACVENKTTIDDTLNESDESSGTTEPKSPSKNICAELGKIKDMTSDSHYYICYASSGTSTEIKSIRMACPNNLIFCQSKKLCATRRLCRTA